MITSEFAFILFHQRKDDSAEITHFDGSTNIGLIYLNQLLDNYTIWKMFGITLYNRILFEITTKKTDCKLKENMLKVIHSVFHRKAVSIFKSPAAVIFESEYVLFVEKLEARI